MPTALLSVHDKTGIVELARGLVARSWTILGSGGTASVLAEAGVPVTDVAELTGVPGILGHRVVTLHPKVHGGLLADPNDPSHLADMARHGIEPIDLVVVNLYPFADEPGIDLIDIGGPALVRAAAKNHARVGVVVQVADYPSVLAEIEESGSLSDTTRRRLARRAFATIAAYDAAIANWFDREDPLPEALHLSLERAQALRYGENPHQRGARYRVAGTTGWWDGVRQVHGKALSYLNVFDADAAWRLVHRFAGPACAVVKHANPCGVAVADSALEAYVRAHACDPVSAFGGIVALNRHVDAVVAEALAPVFTEVVVAPSFSDEALAVLVDRPNLRVLAAPPPTSAALDVRSIDGGFLVQEADVVTPRSDSWRVVTNTQPTDAQWRDLEFAWQVCAAVSSNAIVVAKDLQALGVGAGQQNRVDSVRLAAQRAAGRAVDGVSASDAFFPFRDGLDALSAAGVAAVVQPGGSVRDDEVIAAADEHGIAMVFTGERHFRH